MHDRIAAMMEQYRRARSELRFLDSNLWLGRPRNPEFASGFDIEALRRRLVRYGIAGGLVSHFAALTYGAEWANERLLADLNGTELWAAVTLVPEMFRTAEAGRAYLNEAIARGARAVRVFPVTHAFTLRGWCSGALLDAVAEARLPLIAWHTEVSWEEIRGLCESYPELPVIVEGTPKKIIYHSRLYYALLERCPNLRLELHNLVNYLGLEDIAARFGANRLVFGSYMPVYDPNTSLMQVTHARLTPDAKARIAGGNLEEMVAGVRPL